MVLAFSACGSKTADEYLAEGKAFQARGDRQAALIQFKAALQADPDLHAARMSLAELLVKQHDIEAAIVELGRVVADAPNTPGALPLLAKVLAVSAEPKRALLRLSELKPASTSDSATVQAHIGAVWGVLGDESKASFHLQRALELDAGNAWANLYTARRDLHKGYDLAETRVDQLLVADQSFVEARFLKGELRQLQGDDAGAIKAWREVIELDPGFISAHEALIGHYLARNNLDAAKQQQQLLRVQAQGHPTVAFLDARLLIAENRLHEARDILLRLLALAPDHLGLLTLTGAVEARVGSPVQAAAHLRKAVAQWPGLVAARAELAELELRLGQPAAALRTLQPLLAADSPDKRHLVMASDAQLRLGNPSEADDLLRRAAEASPDDVKLQAARLVRRLQRGDVHNSLQALESLADTSTDTYADEALIFARLARQEFEAALEAVQALEKKSPGLPATSEIRGRAYFAQRRFAEARAAFEETLARDAARFSAVQALALIDQIEDKPAQALQRLEAVVAADPRNAVALVTLAEFGSRANMPAERVVDLLSQAVTAAPGWADPRTRLIDLAIRSRQYKRALEYSRSALSAMPEDESILEAAGRAQFLSGDVEQAVKTLRRRVDAAPTLAAPYLDLARVYSAQGRADAAEAAYKSAVELEPFNEVAQLAYIEQLISSRRASEAQAHIRRYRDRRPNDPLSYALQASYQIRVKQDDAAIATLREGLARTGRPELAARMHGVFVRLRRDADAATLARAWLARNPNDTRFLNQVAMHDLLRGDFRQGEVRLRRVVELMPSNASALNNLAWVVVKNGGNDGLEFARRAMALAPEDATVMDTLAYVLATRGQHAEALTLQRRAIELEPENHLLKLGLARVALSAGDKVLARAELEALKRLGDSFSAHGEVDELISKL